MKMMTKDLLSPDVPLLKVETRVILHLILDLKVNISAIAACDFRMPHCLTPVLWVGYK